MISWWWLIVAFIAGGLLGVFAIALVTLASRADDLHEEYWAGRKEK